MVAWWHGGTMGRQNSQNMQTTMTSFPSCCGSCSCQLAFCSLETFKWRFGKDRERVKWPLTPFPRLHGSMALLYTYMYAFWPFKFGPKGLGIVVTQPTSHPATHWHSFSLSASLLVWDSGTVELWESGSWSLWVSEWSCQRQVQTMLRLDGVMFRMGLGQVQSGREDGWLAGWEAGRQLAAYQRRHSSDSEEPTTLLGMFMPQSARVALDMPHATCYMPSGHPIQRSFSLEMPWVWKTWGKHYAF